MTQEYTAAVDIVERHEVVYDDKDDGMRLSRVWITRAYRGEIEGTSSAELLLAQPDGAFVAQERFTGSIGGRTGTVVLSHGKVASSDGQVAWGVIVPGSGTGELAGTSGSATMVFADGAATMTMRLDG